MEKSRRKFAWIAGIVVVMAIVVGFAVNRHHQPQRYVQSTTPTILVHGYNSSYHAWDKLISTAKADGITKTVEVAEVKIMVTSFCMAIIVHCARTHG